MKKGGLFLIGALVVGLVFTGCSGLFDDIFGTEADSGDDDLSTNLSQDQWADWFNDHPYSDSDARDAVTTFRSKNSYWVSRSPWWDFMHTAWINGDSIPVDGSLSSSWSQGTWESWFDNHLQYDTPTRDTLHTFYRQNPGWGSSNPWWLDEYATWASGMTGSGLTPFFRTWSSSEGASLTFNSNFTVDSSEWGIGIYTFSGTTATVTLKGRSEDLTIDNDKFTWNGIEFAKN